MREAGEAATANEASLQTNRYFGSETRASGPEPALKTGKAGPEPGVLVFLRVCHALRRVYLKVLCKYCARTESKKRLLQ